MLKMNQNTSKIFYTVIFININIKQNFWSTGKTAWQKQSVGRRNNFFSFQFLGSKFRIKISVYQEEKEVIVLGQSSYSLYNKIEKHS